MCYRAKGKGQNITSLIFKQPHIIDNDVENSLFNKITSNNDELYTGWTTKMYPLFESFIAE